MKKTLKIYFTSDMHGYVSPVNYATGQKKAAGLANFIPQFKKDGNTLVLDGGDTIQGSPFAYLQSRKGSAAVFAELMNLAGYDFVTFGNHDFNYGYDYLASYLEHLDAKCLCCNIQDVSGGLSLFPSAVKVMENGLRVGVIGICTDFINIWEKKENLKNIYVGDVRKALEPVYARLRPQTDVLIGLYHGGFERDVETGRVLSTTRENIGYEIARDFDFDLLLTGHQHMALASAVIAGTHVAQTPASAESFVEAEIVWEEAAGDGQEDPVEVAGAEEKTECAEVADAEERTKYAEATGAADRKRAEEAAKHGGRAAVPGHGRIVSCRTTLKPAGDSSDPRALALLAEPERETAVWLDTPKGHFDEPLLPGEHLEMALHGSRIADFFNRVQLWASGADLSTTSLGNEVKGFRRDVTVRDIVSTYIYPNTLVVKEVTGEILRRLLERSAEYFDTDGQGNLCVSRKFLEPKISHYNFDYVLGLDYGFDPCRPEGSRVTHMTWRGRPVEPDQTFALVMNNYRASGTGGYEFLRDCPVKQEILTDMVELIIRYFEEQETGGNIV